MLVLGQLQHLRSCAHMEPLDTMHSVKGEKADSKGHHLQVEGPGEDDSVVHYNGVRRCVVDFAFHLA